MRFQSRTGWRLTAFKFQFGFEAKIPNVPAQTPLGVLELLTVAPKWRLSVHCHCSLFVSAVNKWKVDPHVLDT